MAKTAVKRTVKNETIRPFALSSDNPWTRINYRFDEAEAWQSALATPFIVLPTNREDVRRDAVHAFDIAVDAAAIVEDGFDLNSVELLVLTRDAFAKQVTTIFGRKLSEGDSWNVVVPREMLETTSMSARIDFQIMLVANQSAEVGIRHIRRGGRLASFPVTVSAEKKGHSFNFSKLTAADFQARGLPASTTFHIEVRQPQDLVEACDDVAGVLSVLVHEDAWATLQEIRTGDRVGESLGLLFLSDVITTVLMLASNVVIRDEYEMEEGSVAKRLLGWIADKSGAPLEDLEGLMQETEDRMRLEAYVQETLRLTHSLHKVRLTAEELG